MQLQLKLTLALLATVSLGAVVQLCVAEDVKQGDAYGDDKATPTHAKHIYVDPSAPALGQSYNIPVLRRTMPWPEGTTLAQLAAQAAPQSEQLRRVTGDARELPNEHDALPDRKSRGRQGKRQAPGGQARGGHLDAVQAEPLGHYGEYEHEHYGPHAHVERSFTGLIAYDNQAAGNYYQYSPPDVGVAVGNGYLLETANTVLRVFKEDGTPITNALTLSAFYGYGPDYNVTSEVYGPDLIETACWFDTKSGRWFHMTLGFAQEPNFGYYTGATWIDVAVSQSSNPTGAWNYYQVPAANNGDDGTPDLSCGGGSCFPAWPQMAVWDQALVITVNEYPSAGDEIIGSAVYALDKEALVQGLGAAETMLSLAVGVHTLVPARQFSACELSNEYIMGTPPARYDDLVDTLQLLRLRGTASLSTDHAHVTLEWVEPDVKLPFQYTAPPYAVQKSGVNPAGIVFYGAASGNVTKLYTGGAEIGSVAFVDDKLYAAWGAKFQGVAGAAWALVDPQRPARALDGSVIGMPGGNNLLFPALAVRADSEGVMALTVSGPDNFPSPAYALLTRHGLGPVKLIVNGVGPLDDSNGYKNEFYTATFGHWASAMVDETGCFWLASEWVAQSCSVAEYNGTAPTYVADYTCGGTRSRRKNWATRVSKVVLRT